MFGMEKKSEKKVASFTFDLENDLRDEAKRQQLVKRIEGRIRKIREVLHKGSKKDEFDQLGILLNGYHALAVVLGRASQENQKQKGTS
jgi:hypothetical protein